MKYFYFLLFILPISLFSQENDSYQLDYSNSRKATELCTKYKSNSYTSNAEADNALGKILSVVGASKRFIIAPCENINNALAVINDGMRYILYDPKFLNSISDTSNYWANMSILAHEVGHHINGHTLGSSISAYENKIEELEADEFSGFVMQKLGATLAQSNDAIASIATEGDDTYSSHPNRARRIKAITKGYNNAADNQFIKEVKLKDFEEYSNRGKEKYEADDYEGAIKDFKESIKLKPTDYTYYNIGLSYFELENFSSALLNFQKAIDLSPKSGRAHFKIAMIKNISEDYYGSLSALEKFFKYKDWDNDWWDFTANFYFSKALYNKEIYDKSLDRINWLITEKDLSTELSKETTAEIYELRGLNYSKIDSTNLAISDFIKASELNPKKALYQERVGDEYLKLKQYDIAIEFYNKALFLDENKATVYEYRAYAYAGKDDYFSALFDMNEAIKLTPKQSWYYLKRGVYKLKVNDKKGSCEDWLTGKELGSTEAQEKLIEHCGYKKEDFYSPQDYLSLAKKEYNDNLNYEKALKLFRIAKEKGHDEPNIVDSWIVYCLYMLEDYKAAMTLLESLKNSEDLDKYWKIKAEIDIKFNSKDYQGALVIAENFIEANNLNPDLSNKPLNEDFIKSNLDQVRFIFMKTEASLLSLEQYSRAIKINEWYLRIGKVIENQSIIDIAYYRLANVKFKSAEFLDALQDITESIKLTPLDYSNYELSGDIKLALGAKDNALLDYEKAIDLSVEDKEYVATITLTTKTIAINPNKAKLYYLRAYAKYYSEDYSAALADFNKSIELDPNKVAAYQGIARTYYELENYKAAKMNSTKAIELNPNEAYSYFLRAWHNYKLEDLVNGCKDINKAFELNPEYKENDYQDVFKLVCN